MNGDENAPEGDAGSPETIKVHVCVKSPPGQAPLQSPSSEICEHRLAKSAPRCQPKRVQPCDAQSLFPPSHHFTTIQQFPNQSTQVRFGCGLPRRRPLHSALWDAQPSLLVCREQRGSLSFPRTSEQTEWSDAHDSETARRPGVHITSTRKLVKERFCWGYGQNLQRHSGRDQKTTWGGRGAGASLLARRRNIGVLCGFSFLFGRPTTSWKNEKGVVS